MKEGTLWRKKRAMECCKTRPPHEPCAQSQVELNLARCNPPQHLHAVTKFVLLTSLIPWSMSGTMNR